MPRTTASSSSRKPARATLDQARVVRAAVGIANANGTDALSMRALAGALGVEAMSLYSHVPSKEVLLGLMAAHVMESIDIPPRTLPPLKRLQRLATDLREAAHAHPAVFPLVVLAPLDMRAAVRPTEIALQAFLDAGLSDQRAIRSQRVFLSFVRGYLLWEIGGFTAGRWRASDATLQPASLAEVKALDAAEFPETRRLAATFSRISPDQAFAEGLASMLSSLLPAAARTASRGKR